MLFSLIPGDFSHLKNENNSIWKKKILEIRNMQEKLENLSISCENIAITVKFLSI